MIMINKRSWILECGTLMKNNEILYCLLIGHLQLSFFIIQSENILAKLLNNRDDYKKFCILKYKFNLNH